MGINFPSGNKNHTRPLSPAPRKKIHTRPLMPVLRENKIHTRPLAAGQRKNPHMSAGGGDTGESGGNHGDLEEI